MANTLSRNGYSSNTATSSPAAKTYVKATLVDIDTNSRVECMFNPKEYTFSKKNQWKFGRRSGANMPKLEFSSGDPATMTMQLLFDTYATRKDVREEYTDKIWEMMLVNPSLKDNKSKKARPPKVHFQWGKTWSFDAVITSINQKFTLFDSDGTPLRAVLDVTFQQIKDEKLFPPQNPTSGGTGGERVWVVSEGDTLGWIAYKEYGNTAHWRVIADANRLKNVRRLEPGRALAIPNL